MHFKMSNQPQVIMSLEEYEKLKAVNNNQSSVKSASTNPSISSPSGSFGHRAEVKGVILAGGTGTRLLPSTRVTNKHLLPVYDRPMIFWPLKTLTDAGIRDILIVTGGNSPGDFLKLLRRGDDFGLNELHYTYQEGSGGIADALKLAKDFSDNGKIVVLLGDNIFEDNIKNSVERFREQTEGAKIFVKTVEDPNRFGVVEVKDGKVIGIEEKPQNPKSNLAQTGLYMYSADVFEIIDTLEPSDRGELEITDVNNVYLQRGQLTYETIEGFWGDAGTPDSLLKASNFLAEKMKKGK